MTKQFEKINKLIKDCDCILVGCGNELSIDNLLKKDFSDIKSNFDKYIKDTLNNINNEFINKCLKINYFRNINNYHFIYNNLYDLIQDKNYFIITSNTDFIIYNSKFDKNRIVAPCGDNRLFQCYEGCCNNIWDNNSYIQSLINKIPNIMNEFQLNECMPKCPCCNQKVSFNTINDADKYIEEGYIKQWEKYLDYFSRTLNKKVVMLELGENFNMPTIIRWPFEKNTFINNKAFLIRVNENFPQVNAEIKDKSISIKMNSIEFLKTITSK